jgi:hypothetical protein
MPVHASDCACQLCAAPQPCNCGRTPKGPTPWHHGYTLECEACDTEGTYCFGETPEKAIDEWNERVKEGT